MRVQTIFPFCKDQVRKFFSVVAEAFTGLIFGIILSRLRDKVRYMCLYYVKQKKKKLLFEAMREYDDDLLEITSGVSDKDWLFVSFRGPMEKWSMESLTCHYVQHLHIVGNVVVT